MKDTVSFIAIIGMLWLAFATDIPAKAANAAERWLDQSAAQCPQIRPRSPAQHENPT
jgi:hypothetical protein